MDRLPVEVVIKILSYLNSYDLMQFCNVYENCDYILQEKDIVRTVDFSGKFETQNIHLCKYITTNINYNYIKVLNINFIYWITANDLRRLIRKLENLEALYAIDTKLGVQCQDINEYIKLKQIAVTFDEYQFDTLAVKASKKLRNLKSLCLKISQTRTEYSRIYTFLRGLEELEELWICDHAENRYQINYRNIAGFLKCLKKFVIRSLHSAVQMDHDYEFDCQRCIRIYRHYHPRLRFFMENDGSCGRRRRAPEPATKDYDQMLRAWQFIADLDIQGPCGFKEIFLNQSIRDVYFEDLNFANSLILCDAKYDNAALRILSVKNSKKLKRLSFRSCLLRTYQRERKCKQNSGFIWPRKEEQVPSTSPSYTFQDAANNFKNLRELEILKCERCTTGPLLTAYRLIANFEYLEKLTLEIPHLLDGSFLKEVFVKCPHLKSLSINCLTQNDKFIANLCKNLKYSRNLTHFRLDHTYIPIRKLLNGLDEVQCKKLLRIVVRCDTLQNNDNRNIYFATFMRNNPQLIFCCFVISQNTKKQNIDIQHILNTFKKGSTAKLFFVAKDISSFNGVFPPAHNDIVFNHTKVSMINLIDF